ncbi:MAG: HEAT repeat domain-containing protein [Legionellaceae bacterium]
MIELFIVIKIVAIAQLALIFMLFFYAYGIKIYTYYETKQHHRIKQSVDEFLARAIKTKGDLDKKKIRYFTRYPAILIERIEHFNQVHTSKRWSTLRTAIITSFLTRKYEQSHDWYKRYLTCRIVQSLPEALEHERLLALLNDPVPLVSLTAAKLAIMNQSQELMDSVLDTFAQGRRIQQSLCSQLLVTTNINIIPLIKNRLQREQDPYIKAFCYRILLEIPRDREQAEENLEDINSTNVDLALAALSYSAHQYPSSMRSLGVLLLKDERWEIRARAAKLLGESGDTSVVSSLEESLYDSNWWVRINTAEALSALGTKGLAILKHQHQKKDPFAYDLAQQTLIKKKGSYE